MKRWIIIGGIIAVAGLAGSHLVDAQTPTSVTACGSYSGNLILQNNVSSGGTCITISGNNTTFDGNGKTITASGDAVYIYNKSNVTVKNFTTNGDVGIDGESSDGARVENVNASGISVIRADDVTVTGSTFDLAYLGQEESEIERLTFTNNHVEGSSNKLVSMRGSGNVPCPGGHTITGNTFISHATPSSGDEPMVVFMWCIANSTFSNNTVQAVQTAQGIRVRDGSDNNIFANNTITVGEVEGGSFAALNVTTGNEGVRPNPSGNTFRDNVIRATGSRALRYQGTAGGNLFERNVFWGNDATQASSFEQVSASDTFLYNTFYNSGSGPAVQIEYYNLGGSATTYRNNIFATTGTRAVTGSNVTGALYNGDRNLFYSSGASVVTNRGTVAQWSSSLGDDTNSVFGNPAFVSAGGGNFHLTSGSAALGIADSGTDAGAFQYNGSTPPPACTESWSCGAWSTCANSSQSRTCTDANSCGTTDNRPALTQSCSSGGGSDTTAPTVSITAPANGATVSGTVSFTANASDNIGVAGVTFYVNGAALWPEDTTAPYSVPWITTNHTNGSTKTLTAVARDAANNSTTTSGRSVTIQQAASPCVESWSCGSFSACVSSSQSRTCTDANNCGTTANRPPLTQSCVGPDVTAPAAVSNLRA